MARPSRLPPLKALRALEALHETGSVTGAARLLNVSHSAISHQIKILEAWTPHPLFLRQGRMTVLTAAGRSLAGVAHEAFDAIRHEMDRLPLRGMRSISIASLPLVATEWLMPRLRGFTAAHPEINLHLSLSQSDRPITPTPDIELRFAVRAHLIPSDIVLFAGDAVPVCAPELLQSYGGDIDRLLTQGPLVYDEDLRMWSLWFETMGLVRQDAAAVSGLIVEGSSLLRASAIAGHGVALCRTALMEDDIQTGRLVRIWDHPIDTGWCYFLRCADARRAEPGIRDLLEWLAPD